MKSQEKPTCKLTGEDGNVFNLIGLASRCLKKAGLPEQVKEMTTRIFKCRSYEEALVIISEYIDIE